MTPEEFVEHIGTAFAEAVEWHPIYIGPDATFYRVRFPDGTEFHISVIRKAPPVHKCGNGLTTN